MRTCLDLESNAQTEPLHVDSQMDDGKNSCIQALVQNDGRLAPHAKERRWKSALLICHLLSGTHRKSFTLYHNLVVYQDAPGLLGQSCKTLKQCATRRSCLDTT